MTPLIVTLAILFPPARPDYGFMYATEDWVIDTCPRPLRLSDHAPPDVAGAIMRLGDDCYRCRERAKGDLEAMGERAIPWLFWGLRHRADAQIRLGCWTILKDRCTCPYCKGERQCPKYYPTDESWACAACGCGRSTHEDDSVERLCRRCNIFSPYIQAALLRF